MKHLYVVVLYFICFILSACYTEHKASKTIAKAGALHPKILATYCARAYPPGEFSSDSTIIIKRAVTDTLYKYIDCDTVLNNSSNHGNIVRIACPDIRTADTIIKIQYRQVVNKALHEQYQAEAKSLSEKHHALKGKYSIINKAFIILIIYTVLRVILKLWKINLP